MKRPLVALLAGLAVFATVYAAAAGVTLHVFDLGAAEEPVLSCDSSLTFSFTLDANDAITQVTVGDIAPACANGLLKLTLTNAGKAAVASGSGTVPVGGGSLVVPVTPHPSNAEVVYEQVAIVGP